MAFLNRKSVIYIMLYSVFIYLAVLSINKITILKNTSLFNQQDEIIIKGREGLYSFNESEIYRHPYGYYPSPQIEACMERVQQNYTLINGVFVDKNTDINSLPKDFNFMINPENTCYDYIPYPSDDVGEAGFARKKLRIAKEIFIVTIIHTAPKNFENRLMIRETWGSIKEFYNLNIRTLFILGYPQSDPSLQPKIQSESDTYGDIVQASFHDSYFNLTYKMITGYKWVSYYCPHASFVLKMDDDIYVDIFEVMAILDKLRVKYGDVLISKIDLLRPKDRVFPYVYNQTLGASFEDFDYHIVSNDVEKRFDSVLNATVSPFLDDSNNDTSENCVQSPNMLNDKKIRDEYNFLFGDMPHYRDFLICCAMVNSPLLRDNTSKWYVSREDYPSHFYEPYCSGWAVILSPALAFKLYKAYFSQKYLFVDDAHVTGKLARIAGSILLTICPRVQTNTDKLETWVKFSENNTVTSKVYRVSSKINFYFCYNGGNRKQMQKYWNQTLIAHDIKSVLAI